MLRADDLSDFDRRMAPWLIDHCIDCHSGPNAKGKLDLTSKAAVLKGGRSGPAVVEGKPADSILWQRVRDGEMPPKKPLAPKDAEPLKQWIAGGAKWGTDPIDPFRVTTSKRAGADWWSLRPVQAPTPPSVKNETWPRQPLDRFILAALDTKGQKPSPEAHRRTLIRRLNFDLIGLPPSPDEVDAFEQDERPDAYERVVDRLLASKHYGERWARHWLDVVRFGESDGFERNAPRQNAWHYRDWIIRALNDDMPFDDFCRLQLAGDVLKSGDPDAAKATGFLVAGIHNTVLPGTALARETAFQDELEDLVGTVGQTFLGLTVNCGRCHDHKFDPISQKDYYRIASALSGVRHGERPIPAPKVVAELAEVRKRIDEAAKQLREIEDPIRKMLAAEGKESAAVPAPIAAWDFRESLKDRIGGLEVKLIGGAKTSAEGVTFDGKTGFAKSTSLPQALSAKTLEAWVRLATLDQAGGGVMSVQADAGGVFDAIVFGEREPRRWMAGSDFFRRTRELKGPAETSAANEVVQIAITYAPDGTITAYRDGKPYGEAYKSSGPIRMEAGKAVVAFGIRHEPAGDNRMLAGTIVQARLYDRALAADEVAGSAVGGKFITEAERTARLSPEAREKRAALTKAMQTLRSRQAELDSLHGAKVYTNVPQQPTTTRLLNRGQAAEPREVVAVGGLPMVAGGGDFGLAPDAPEGERRKKLAEWITRRDNPLFARVLVNRLWHHHFGVGIVETPNDFGFNGGRPSHPELLDHLASEFAKGGYRLKAMHRMIVCSSTYRQASLPRQAGLEKDADNRLLWRYSPRRLDGESLRDTMLEVAGLLNREVGGKGFSDYKQRGGAGTDYYDPIDPVGPEFHRRSIYRFLPRSGNQGLLDVFDCPDPAAAAPRRNVTTTPLQALALWNGQFALRMAEVTHARVESEVKRSTAGQIRLAYRLMYQREPLPAEMQAARQLVDQHGLTSLCRALFNSNEFLTAE
ncbi:MAG: DUF1553 domain-containing protein [Gemmataceae bacterium]|nr:DUF1553 domain-containing protein [Gemmataceae bacterium]